MASRRTAWFKAAVVGLLGLAGLGGVGSAHAQILIGQPAGFTGPTAAGVREITAGARLVIDAVNARGGIGGQRIELVSVDDGFDPARTVELARDLVERRNVLALFLTRGTPNALALLPMLSSAGVPLVAPSTGAIALHRPVHPWVFNVRAQYQREAERVVDHVAVLGLARIGVMHVDDSFGADLMAGVTRGFARTGLRPAFVQSVDRVKPSFDALVTQALASRAQAMILIGSSKVVADATIALRSAGVAAQVFTFSNNASEGFVKALGAHGRGVVVAQVFPSERLMTTGLARQAKALADPAGVTLTPSVLEGFAAARVLVEGLRRAAPPLTRQSLRASLERLTRLDLGGMELSYDSDDHTGLEFVDLSMIGADGRFLR